MLDLRLRPAIVLNISGEQRIKVKHQGKARLVLFLLTMGALSPLVWAGKLEQDHPGWSLIFRFTGYATACAVITLAVHRAMRQVWGPQTWLYERGCAPCGGHRWV